MDEIIKEIIAIDKEAAEKLEEANRMKDEVLKKQLQEENQELKKKMHDRAQMHLDSVRSIEQKHAVEAIAQIDADKDKALALSLIHISPCIASIASTKTIEGRTVSQRSTNISQNRSSSGKRK